MSNFLAWGYDAAGRSSLGGSAGILEYKSTLRFGKRKRQNICRGRVRD
jgi:hypothetical protein